MLIWIPGHTGIIGNEIVDKYAKIAVSDTDTNVLNLLLTVNSKTPRKPILKKKWQIKAKPLNLTRSRAQFSDGKTLT